MSKKNNATESIAEKMERLNRLVAWFESDDFVLEHAIDRFMEARSLADEIERDLSALRNEITVLKQKFDQQ